MLKQAIDSVIAEYGLNDLRYTTFAKNTCANFYYKDDLVGSLHWYDSNFKIVVTNGYEYMYERTYEYSKYNLAYAIDVMLEGFRKAYLFINGSKIELEGILINKCGDVYRESFVDSLGRKYNGKFKKPCKDRDGYLCVNVSYKGRCIKAKIHRLVASTFLENPRKNSEVNHIDGNKENNNVNNLEWVEHTDNMKHAHKTGLVKYRRFTDNEIKFIREKQKDGTFTYRELTKIFSVSQATIWKIITHQIYKEVERSELEGQGQKIST